MEGPLLVASLCLLPSRLAACSTIRRGIAAPPGRVKAECRTSRDPREGDTPAFSGRVTDPELRPADDEDGPFLEPGEGAADRRNALGVQDRERAAQERPHDPGHLQG